MHWRVHHGLADASGKDTRRLLVAARQVKEALSTQEEAGADVTLSWGQQMHLKLKRAEFEHITAGLVQKTLGPTRKALRDAGIHALPGDVVRIVLPAAGVHLIAHGPGGVQ